MVVAIGDLGQRRSPPMGVQVCGCYGFIRFRVSKLMAARVCLVRVFRVRGRLEARVWVIRVWSIF